MAAREKGGRVVFIGNIPYGMEKEDIEKLFGQIGKVLSLRLVVDKDTHKPKGFGFLEYGTPAEADSAIRNLNNKEIQGRTLRVDYSNDNEKGGKPAEDGLALPVGGQVVGGSDSSALPPLPAGVEVAPGLTAPDAISKTVSALPAPQLLDILSQMKALVTSDPAKATALLQQAPQLSFALFQALLLLNLVSTDVLASLVASVQGGPPPQPPQQAVQPPAFQPQMPPGYAPIPQYQQPGYPPQNYATPPPPQVAAYQAPPPAQQPGFGAPPPGFTPEIVEAVRQITRDQILMLAEPQRNEVFKIRVAIGLPPMPN
ncbi:hypothetical protein AMS68_001985 [Peltaster fructicola]|uniref:RRM domain-containing protein n=1 Tax=Peltaster fructicola TaxID=286661 RepID=A0A6H0XPB0_9PEZI|nr:hypothetical protein AMS68_001985 [Peltaster fructicola]